eukprot:CAMPEP_0116853288 /NCGR_PEP_ID=MMETSP0418-20121206/17824_1 /TAXON_ID=1158023 /ORGANISM="Astrosyne radiata, Strain 13vi08-1A" /LENGTH=401 /DNA_ID=CAMNT_0004485663 /DNA_START=167 /DNA_END=1372 /DNA_ORIENTATION=+
MSGDGRVLSIVDFGAISDTSFGVTEHHRFTEFHSFAKPSQDPWWMFRQDLDVVSITQTNTRAFNLALQQAKPGDTILVPEGESFSFTGGIVGRYLRDVTLDVSGSMHFVHDQDIWPQFPSKHKGSAGDRWGFLPAIHIVDSSHVTLTCSASSRPTVTVNSKTNEVNLHQETGSAGVINGNGKIWWDEAILGRLPHKDPDYRPRLVLVESSVHVLVENLTLLNSPFWTLTVEGMYIEVSNINVLVDRKYQTKTLASVATPTDVAVSRSLRRRDLSSGWFPNDIPDWVGRKIRQPQDLNTDGIDPRGMHIFVHDCIIQNADDSVAVKPPVDGVFTTALNGTIPIACTHNVTIQNMVLTGFGASIGSVGPLRSHPCVDQVIFKNITMPGTGKGKCYEFLVICGV